MVAFTGFGRCFFQFFVAVVLFLCRFFWAGLLGMMIWDLLRCRSSWILQTRSRWFFVHFATVLRLQGLLWPKKRKEKTPNYSTWRALWYLRRWINNMARTHTLPTCKQKQKRFPFAMWGRRDVFQEPDGPFGCWKQPPNGANGPNAKAKQFTLRKIDSGF